jgi:hypothetical protein
LANCICVDIINTVWKILLKGEFTEHALEQYNVYHRDYNENAEK